MTYQEKIHRKYRFELFGAAAVYCVLIFTTIHFARPMAEGPVRTLLLVSPMAGFALMLWAIVRHFGRLDEYLRMRLLENISVAAGITGGLTFTYGFLETTGMPRLSMFAVWMVLCGSFGLVQCGRKVLGRE
jgi:hypothetical protein